MSNVRVLRGQEHPGLAADPEPRLFDVATVAGLLGVSIRFVRSLVAGGQLRVVRLGRRTLVPREEIDRIAAGGAS